MKRFIVLGVLALVALSAYAYAAKKPGHVDYKEYKLDNGLRVILSEDRSVPIAAVNIWYHVGSAHEEEGRSGFAHLFEHMMFEGSENVEKREHSNLIQRAGGNYNGTTNQDRTLYFEIVPANQLNLVLWLEADRMRSLKITTENFENQRNAVKEERLMRIDNQPYGAAFLTVDTLSYDFKPYSHTVIGKMVDLDAAEAGDVQRFFDNYYSPSNAVLVIVGDIDMKKTMKMVEKYFGEIPAGRVVPPISGVENPHAAERRKVIDDKNANVPAIFMNYMIPPHAHEDTPALDLLSNILTDGESSRLYQRLVKKEEAAVAVFGGTDSRRGPSVFRFVAASNVGVDIGTCESLIYEELDRLKTEGIASEELEKAKKQFRTDFIQSRETVMNKAEALQHYAFYHDDLSAINKDIDEYMAVTQDDIIRIAKKYFTQENRTVVIANPASRADS
ncbi:MAG: insulinase family protein [Candidatus Krumholzibacteria bacterium]|nr:insulinase family protein [Candidatus Krumholzibacteria bacterium]